MKALVLGSGPSAAFAAGAINDYPGWTGRVVSPTPPFLGGALGSFYFHSIPPTLEEKIESYKLLTTGIGEAYWYMKRQWPNHPELWDNPSSFPLEDRHDLIYNPTEVLPWLWDGARVDQFPYPLSDTDIRDVARAYDMTFVTFPTQELKSNREGPVSILVIEVSRELWEQAFLGQFHGLGGKENIVLYNGEEDDDSHWVRASSLFGTYSIEYGHGYELTDRLKKVAKRWTYRKDLPPDTKPWKVRMRPDIRAIGRFGLYDRRYLSHYAYWDVQKTLEETRHG